MGFHNAADPRAAMIPHHNFRCIGWVYTPWWIHMRRGFPITISDASGGSPRRGVSAGGEDSSSQFQIRKVSTPRRRRGIRRLYIIVHQSSRRRPHHHHMAAPPADGHAALRCPRPRIAAPPADGHRQVFSEYIHFFSVGHTVTAAPVAGIKEMCVCV